MAMIRIKEMDDDHMQSRYYKPNKTSTWHICLFLIGHNWVAWQMQASREGDTYILYAKTYKNLDFFYYGERENRYRG